MTEALRYPEKCGSKVHTWLREVPYLAPTQAEGTHRSPPDPPSDTGHINCNYMHTYVPITDGKHTLDVFYNMKLDEWLKLNPRLTKQQSISPTR